MLTLFHKVENDGRATIILKNGDGVLHLDRLNPLSAKARAAFTAALCEKFKGLDRTEVDRRLLEIAAEVAARPPVEKPGQGRPVEFSDVPPWPEPVDGAALLEDIAGVIRRYIVLPPTAADLLAVWCLHTWVFQAFDITPYLHITSATKRCGKSNLKDVLSEVVYRPLSTASVTAAVIFRVVEQARPTLLIDETDSFLQDKNDLLGLLNDGWKSSGEAVRCVEPSWEPRRFSTFCPKALVGIGALPKDTTEDRCLQIKLQRKTSTEQVERLRLRELVKLTAPIKQKCRRWADDHFTELTGLVVEAPAEIQAANNRLANNLEVLLAVATLVGGAWPGRICAAGRELAGRDVEVEDMAVQLLGDIQNIFNERGTDRLSTVDLLADLNHMEERPWATWSRGRELNAYGLGKLLRRFGIKPDTLRLSTGDRLKGYRWTAFQDAFGRYLTQENIPTSPSASVTSVTSLNLQGNSTISIRDKNQNVTDTKTAQPLEITGLSRMSRIETPEVRENQKTTRPTPGQGELFPLKPGVRELPVFNPLTLDPKVTIL